MEDLKKIEESIKRSILTTADRDAIYTLLESKVEKDRKAGIKLIKLIFKKLFKET